jgi:hypothetical protein
MHSALGKRARPSRGFQLRSSGQEILKVAQRDIRLRRHRFDSFETEVASEAWDTAELRVLAVVFLAILVSSIEPIGLRHRCRFLREIQPGSLFQGQQENT